jgi:hypothetical protein
MVHYKRASLRIFAFAAILLRAARRTPAFAVPLRAAPACCICCTTRLPCLLPQRSNCAWFADAYGSFLRRAGLLCIAAAY